MNNIDIDMSLTDNEKIELADKVAQLADVTYNQLGLQAIIDKGFALLENPFFVRNSYYDVIGYSNCEVDESILPWTDFIHNRQQLDTINRLKNENAFRILAAQSTPALHDFPFNNMRSLAIKLDLKGEMIGHLVVYEYFRNFSHVDFHIISYLAKAIVNELQKESLSENLHSDLLETFLCKILARDTEQINEKKLNYFNIKFKKNLRIALAKFHDSYNMSVSIEYLMLLIETTVPHIKKSFLYNGNICILFESDDDLFISEDSKNKLNEIAKKYNIHIGVSDIFNTITDAYSYYEQALNILHIIDKLVLNQGTYFYIDYCMFIFIDSIPKNIDIRSFISPSILYLMEYDKEKNTNYTETLKAYIHNGQDINKTAEDLCLHRNTVDYRIKKINSLTPLHMDRTNVLCRLIISFRILEYLNLH